MVGLFDFLTPADRQQAAYQGLTGLGMALAQAGGPSTMPGGALRGLGMGLGGFGSAYQNALNSTLAQRVTGLQAAKLARENARDEAWNAAFGLTPTGEPSVQPIQVADASQPGAVSMAARMNAPLANNQIPANSMLAGVPKQMIPTIAALGPEKGGAILAQFAMKDFGTDHWTPQIGPDGKPTGLQVNARTGEIKPISPKLVEANINPNITLPTQESAFQREYGAELGKQAAKIFEEGDTARNQAVAAQRMRQLVNDWKAVGGSQGQFAQAQSRVTALAQAFGVSPESLGLPKDAGPAQAIDALMRKMAIGNIGGQGGMPANNFSEADRNFIVDMQPNLKDTPEGFDAKLAMVEKMAQRSLEKEDMWNRMSGEGKTYAEFRRQWAAYVNKNPLFSAEEKAQIKAISGKSAPSASNGLPPPPAGFVVR